MGDSKTEKFTQFPFDHTTFVLFQKKRFWLNYNPITPGVTTSWSKKWMIICLNVQNKKKTDFTG